MNNTTNLENVKDFTKVAKVTGTILQCISEEAMKYVGPVTDAIVNCKSIVPDTIVKVVNALEPGFEKFSEQFFHYLEKRNFEALILSNPALSADEQKDMLKTVSALQCEKMERIGTLIAGCAFSALALVGTYLLASQGISSFERIHTKELSLEATIHRCEALSNIFNPVRGIINL